MIMKENKHLSTQIEAILKHRQVDEHFKSLSSADALLENLSIYHRELSYQNDELKRIEQELLREKEYYKKMLEALPCAYFIIDSNQVIHFANKMAKETILAFDAHPNSDFSFYKILSPDSQDDWYLGFRTLQHAGDQAHKSLNVTTLNAQSVRLMMTSYTSGEENFFAILMVPSA